MKKISFLIMLFALIFTLCACGDNNNTEVILPINSIENSTDEVNDINPSQDEIEEEKLYWELNYYIDEFKEKTNHKYIKTTLEGTFNNSATNNSDLGVSLVIDDFDIYFKLFEYGSQQVKNSSDTFDDEYGIVLRDENGTKYTLTGWMFMNSDKLYLDAFNKSTFLDLLNTQETFKVYIVNKERETTNYLFEVYSSNFKELYKELQTTPKDVILTDEMKSVVGLWKMTGFKDIEVEREPTLSKEYYQKSFFQLNTNGTFKIRFKSKSVSGIWTPTDNADNTFKLIPFNSEDNSFTLAWKKNDKIAFDIFVLGTMTNIIEDLDFDIFTLFFERFE